MKEVKVENYGIFPDSTEDMTENFAKMFAENKSDAKFVLPKGVYHFSADKSIKKYYPMSNTNDIPVRNISVELDGMHNICFDGNGSVFEFAGTTVPVSVVNSSDITVKSLSFDWKIPLAVESIITAANEEYIEVKISEESPYVVEDEWLWFTGENWKEKYFHCCEFDCVTKKIAYRSGDSFRALKMEDLGNRSVRIWGKYKRTPKVGNIMVLRHGVRRHPGIFGYMCKNLTVSDVAIHGTGGLGVLAQFCENLTFYKVRFEASAARHRQVISGRDDGLHLSNNKGRIVVDSCWFHGLADDPINVHGTSIRVLEVLDDRRVKCEFVHSSSINLDRWAVPSDEVAFYHNENMSLFGSGVVSSYEQLTPTEMVITFRDPMPAGVVVKTMLENTTNTPSLEVRNSYFGSCRARGILVTTRRPVLIENNLFETAGSAILMSGDGNRWFESGAVQDVTIRNNVFGDSCLTSTYQFCNGIISICPEIPQPDPAKCFHANIKIEHNIFHAFDYPVLYAFSVKGLNFSDNNIIRSNMYEPFHPNQNTFTLDYCDDVRISENRFIGDVLGRDILLFHTDRSAVSAQDDLEIKVKE